MIQSLSDSNEQAIRKQFTIEILRRLRIYSLKDPRETTLTEAADPFLDLLFQVAKVQFQNGVECGKQIREIEVYQSSKTFTDETVI